MTSVGDHVGGAALAFGAARHCIPLGGLDSINRHIHPGRRGRASRLATGPFLGELAGDIARCVDDVARKIQRISPNGSRMPAPSEAGREY
jgi:hypothetical protein